jgi:hypothetical protein
VQTLLLRPAEADRDVGPSRLVGLKKQRDQLNLEIEEVKTDAKSERL